MQAEPFEMEDKAKIFKFTDFLSGLAAGCVFTIASQPMDYVKTQIQTLGKRLSPIDVAKYIWNKAGLNVRAYYSGSSTMFLGNSLLVSQELGLNETIHRFFRDKVNKNDQQLLPLYQVAISGTIAGSISSLTFTPLEYCKIAMQLGNKETAKYSSAMGIFIDKIRKWQFRDLTKGTVACVLREGIGGTVYFLFYELVLRSFMKHGQKSHHDSQSRDIILAGAMAGLWIVPVYPIDVVKTMIQGGLCSSYRESIQLVRQQKLAWRGLTWAASRSVIGNSVLFMTFEKVQNLFDNTKF